MPAKSVQLATNEDIASLNEDGQPNYVLMGLAARIQQKTVGLPDAFWAKQAKVSTSAFALLKAGRRMPKADVLFSVAEALRVSPAWLMKGDAPGGATLLDANNADFVQLPRYQLANLTDTGKGDPIETLPYRKDWLFRRLGVSSGLWITELPSDYEALGLEEGDAIICSDIDKAGPAEKWVCIFRGTAGPFVARYSNRGTTGELDFPDALFVTAADLKNGETFVIARIRARMLAKL